MVDVIDYPTNKVKPDSLPEPGDQYQAYGLVHRFKPPTIHFVFPDWSMVSFPYASSGMGSFQLRNDDGDCHGECAIMLVFESKAPGLSSVVVITGRNLHDFFWHLGNHQVHWLWALPEPCAGADESAPVVHSIEVKEANRATLDAMLAKPAA